MKTSRFQLGLQQLLRSTLSLLPTWQEAVVAETRMEWVESTEQLAVHQKGPGPSLIQASSLEEGCCPGQMLSIIEDAVGMAEKQDHLHLCSLVI